MADVKKNKGERRNAYLNLAWTGPADNTSLQDRIPLAKVQNMALDMFLGCAAAVTAETAVDSEAAGDDAEHTGQPQRRAAEILETRGRRPWKIPHAVERGFEIPMLVTNSFSCPEIGKFKRLGMDVVVNAVWLAYYWAKKEGCQQAMNKLENMILDWPFDFVLIKGNTPEEVEEGKFKFACHMSARVERLRDFVGLENANLMRIVAQAATVVEGKSTGGKKATAEKVHQWLTENVNWGLFPLP